MPRRPPTMLTTCLLPRSLVKARLRLAKLYRRIGDYKGAIEMAEHALTMLDDGGDTHDKLLNKGQAHFEIARALAVAGHSSAAAKRNDEAKKQYDQAKGRYEKAHKCWSRAHGAVANWRVARKWESMGGMYLQASKAGSKAAHGYAHKAVECLHAARTELESVHRRSSALQKQALMEVQASLNVAKLWCEALQTSSEPAAVKHAALNSGLVWVVTDSDVQQVLLGGVVKQQLTDTVEDVCKRLTSVSAR